MSMKLGFDLTIEQAQKLVMTPEMIQAIQILQFSTQELETYVEEQLLINPVLEYDTAEASERDSRDEHEESFHGDQNQREAHRSAERASREDFDWKQYIRDKEYDDISYRQGEYTVDEDKGDPLERYAPSDVTLPEHLLFQAQCAGFSYEEKRIGQYIIESLDENGYLTASIAEMSKALHQPEEMVQNVLSVIQTFEPLGVGAADLQECLLIQLRQQGQLTELFERVIRDHLDDLAANRIGVIARQMGISSARVQQISDVIRTLEPKPGRQFASQTETKYVIPDIIVEKIDDEYLVTINDKGTPSLMVSPYYRKLLNSADKDEELSEYLSERINSALWLIKSIEQRRQTIYNVVSAVVRYQRDFFEAGAKHLKTLTLKEIADELNIHESTVSRAISGKYLQCGRGVFEIKYFFSAGVSGSTGESISSTSIKEFIKEIIDEEDSASPYSDQDMAQMLQEKGIRISRRTVAKYRDEMHILSSSKRRRY